MAIVVGSYVSACMCRDVRVTGEDLEKRNPMVLFLYTSPSRDKTSESPAWDSKPMIVRI